MTEGEVDEQPLLTAEWVEESPSTYGLGRLLTAGRGDPTAQCNRKHTASGLPKFGGKGETVR